MNFSRGKKLLIAAAALVTAEFALFGKVLSNLVPPVDNVDIKVGIASIASLVILLLISLINKGKSAARFNRISVFASGGLLAVGVALYFYYEGLQGEYVYRYPPEPVPTQESVRYVRGELHAKGRERVGNITIPAAIAYYGGLETVLTEQLLWDEKSQRSVELRLIAVYISLVLAIGAALSWLIVRMIGP